MNMVLRRPMDAAAGGAGGRALPTRAIQIANAVIFQAAWFAAVLGAAHDAPMAGTLCVLAALMWHLSVSAQPLREARLVVLACAVGLVVETIGVHLGWIAYASGQPLAQWPPYWLVALWGLLAMALNVTLRWLRQRLWLAALLGAVAGPLSFICGVRLGAGHFIDAAPALVELAIAWAIAMPLLVRLSVRHDGVREEANCP